MQPAITIHTHLLKFSLMKKHNFLLLFLPLLFVGCTKDYEDKVLPGNWVSEGRQVYSIDSDKPLDLDAYPYTDEGGKIMQLNADGTGIFESYGLSGTTDTVNWFVTEDNFALVIHKPSALLYPTNVYQLLKVKKNELVIKDVKNYNNVFVYITYRKAD